MIPTCYNEPLHLVNMVSHRSVTWRSVVQQGGVSFFPRGEAGEAERVKDVDFMVPVIDGAIIKVGKLHYMRLKG